MIKLLKLLAAVTSTACIVGLIYFSTLHMFSSKARDGRSSSNQKEMMTIVLEWGRLAPFPANATSVSIETEGNSFTRSFHASFVAPQQDIQAWIKDSPGINEATPQELSENKVKYIISPTGGANSVEVTIDFALDKIDIYVSWG